MVWARRRDEDQLDRVNRLWTVLILGIAGVALVVYVAVFPDDAVSCLPMSLYANRFCLTQSKLRSYDSGSSYFYPDLDSYHPFLPMFLFIQILLFLFPHVLAHFLAGIIGNETDFLFLCAEKSKSTKDQDDYIQSKLKSPPSPSQTLAILFLLKKLLVLLNSLIQLMLVAVTAQPLYYESNEAAAFPATAFCKAGTEIYHCAFNVNGIIHKIYICLFFWLLALTIMNIGSLIAWVLKLFLPRLTSKTINTYTMTLSSDNPEKTQKFLKEVVGRDYLLNLLLAESTEREITAGDLTLKLWQGYEPYQPKSAETVETTPVEVTENEEKSKVVPEDEENCKVVTEDEEKSKV